MHVLFITNGLPTEKYPEFCVFNKEQIDSVCQLDGVTGDTYFINARENGRIEYLKAIIELKPIIDSYDLIHCFHGLSLIAVSRMKARKPVVVSFLNSISNEYREAGYLAPLFSLWTRRILSQNSYTAIFKDTAAQGLSSKTVHLPNGVDATKFDILSRESARSELGLDQERIYVLFVSSKSRYRKQKRFDRFLSVIDKLKSRFNNIDYLVLENEARNKVPFYFNAANLHLLTSDFEGSPNSVKESLACGTPVVSTDVGNVRSMLEGLQDSLCVSTFDVETIAEACETILGRQTNRHELRTTIFDKGLDMAASTRKLALIYEEAIWGK